MKKFLVMLLIITLSMGLIVGCSQDAQTDATEGNEETTEGSEETIVWKLDHVTPEDHPWHLASVRFQELIEEKSEGRMKIEIYPNSSSGAEQDSLNGISLGTTDITMTGGSFEPYAPI